MAIVRMGGGGELAPRTGLKTAAKGAKHPAKKHPGKKHPGKKHAGKKAAKKVAKKAAKHAHDELDEEMLDALDALPEETSANPDDELARAFHHLQRAGAVISLLEHDSGGDLRMLLEHGIELYRKANGSKAKQESVLCAHGLLRAAEHLGMAGLYSARASYRVEVAPPPRSLVAEHLKKLAPRLDKLDTKHRQMARRLESMARELLRRAGEADHDPHLEYELTMAADGICTALENGL